MRGRGAPWWPVLLGVFAAGFLAGAWEMWPAHAPGAPEGVLRTLGALAMAAVGVEFLIAAVVALLADD